METRTVSVVRNDDSVRLFINNKFLAISMLSIILLSTIALAQTQFLGDSNFGVEVEVLHTDEYGIGVTYDSSCITNCNLPIRFKYNGTDYPTTLDFYRENVSWDLIQVNGDDLDVQTIQWMKNTSYSEQVYNGDVFQEHYNHTGLNLTDENSTHLAHNIAVGNTTYVDKNDAYNYVASETEGWYTDNVSVPSYIGQDAWRWELVNFSYGDSYTLNNNEKYVINYVVKRNTIDVGDATDVIPIIYDFEFTEAQWFNVTFMFRYPIVVNETVSSPFAVNTGTTTIWTKSTDLAYVYSTASGPTGEIAVANGTDEKVWEDENTLTGNQPTSVFDNESLAGVYHMIPNGESINDSTSNGNDGTILGGVMESTDGVFENASNLNNAQFVMLDNETFSAGDRPELPVYTSSGGNYSISMWVRNNTPNFPSQALYGEGWSGGDLPLINFQTSADATGQILVVLRNNGGSFPITNAGSDATSDLALFSTGYHHLCWTDDNGDTEMYIDGQLDPEDFDYTPSALTLNRAYIGRNIRGGTFDAIFDGSIDEVRIYSKKLTQAECQRHYNEGIENFTILGAEELLSTPPTFSNIVESPTSPVTYSPGAQYQFNTTWANDTVTTVQIEHNFTGTLINESVTIDSGGVASHNEVDLPAGVYQWRQIAENVANQVNETPIQTYTVDKASTQLIISAIPSTTVTYPTLTTITGSQTNVGDNDVTYQMFRDEVLIDSAVNANAGEVNTLPVGVFQYKFNTTSGQNYTANNTGVSLTVTVNQGTPTIALLLDGSASNSAFTYPTATNITASESNSGDNDVTYSIIRNGATIESGSSIERVESLSATTHNITYSASGGQNWTSAFIEFDAVGTKGTPTITLLLDGSASNSVFTYPTATNMTAFESNTGDDDMTYSMIRNDITIQTGSSIERVESLSATTHNITYAVNSGENWTSSSVEFDAVGTKAVTSITHTLNGTAGDVAYTYPQVTETAVSESNIGDDDVTYTLTRNGTTIGTGSVTVVDRLSAEDYEFVYTSTTGENYTGTSITRIASVSQGATSITLALNGTEGDVGYNFGEATQASASSSNVGDDDITYTLDRNGTSIGTGSTVTVTEVLSAETHVFTYSHGTGQNWTSNTVSRIATVGKVPSSVTLTINGTAGDFLSEVGQLTVTTGTIVAGETADLYRDGVIVASGSPATESETLTVGYYNYTYTHPESQNFTASSVTRFLTVIEVVDSTVEFLANNTTVDNFASNDPIRFEIENASEVAFVDVQYDVSGKTIDIVERNAQTILVNFTAVSDIVGINITAQLGDTINELPIVSDGDNVNEFIIVGTPKPRQISIDGTILGEGTGFTYDDATATLTIPNVSQSIRTILLQYAGTQLASFLNITQLLIALGALLGAINLAIRNFDEENGVISSIVMVIVIMLILVGVLVLI